MITDKSKQLLAISSWLLACPAYRGAFAPLNGIVAANLFLSTFTHQPKPSEAELKAKG
jgi:hypothetical protein